MLRFRRDKQFRVSTKEKSLELAKQFAEDWHPQLRGKDRAGLLRTGRHSRTLPNSS